MYKLLIVDDEPDVVNGLCAYFEDFDELELDIYTAYSGYEALDILNDTRIDIILSDILMPGMTGLELLEKVRANWPHCCVIFLTGHDEFSYVYTAIRYEYVYYLLKTEGFHAIGKTLVKAAAQIENHLKMSELLKKSEEYMETALPFMQKDYLANLLNGDEDNAADRSRQFKELKIPLDWNRPVLLLLGRMTGLDGNLSSYERSRLIFAVQAVAEEYFPKGIHAFFLPIDRYLLLWIIQPGEEEEKSGELWQHIKNQTKSSAEVIQNICLDQLNLSISFILDCDKAAWEEVSQRYSSLKTLIHYHLGPESELLLMTRSPEMGLPQQDFIYGYRKLKSLETYLESLQRDEFLNTLLEIYENLKKTDNLSRNALLEVYYTVALTILGYINRYGLTEKISYHTGLDKLIRIEEHASWQDAMEYLSAPSMGAI